MLTLLFVVSCADSPPFWITDRFVPSAPKDDVNLSPHWDEVLRAKFSFVLIIKNS